jgi:serine/threonine protein kinase
LGDVNDFPESRLGPYEITREIGRGGMGVVYLARDTKLDRDVAIKALPEELADDADRLVRFEREARTLAQLNHPNVAGIFGLEEQDGQKYLILEYVDGETLAERLDRGAMPVDEALEVAIEIAAGVEAAHEAGIIHRDLKPDNIKITPDGAVKVLDFGLARSTETSSTSTSAGAATRTSPIPRSPTIPGAIMGTAPYMSPEQARGRPVDKRTDIWSFGVVLYEMLAGVSPFAGETAGDSIGAVLHKPIELAALPATTAPIVRHVLERCLERDKSRRYRDIGDVRIELASAAAGMTSGYDARSQTHPGKGAAWARPWGIAALLVIVIGTGAAGFLSGKRAVPQPEPQRDRFEIPIRQAPTFNVGRPAISPDGTMIAYLDQGAVWIRHLDSFDSRRVEGSEHGETPFWSPDSAWLGFGRGAELVKVPAQGGRPTMITRAQSGFSIVGGAQWSKDDRIFFATGDTGIYEVSANGGEPRMYVPLKRPDDDDFHELALLPDGKTLVFTVHSRTRPWYLAISDGTDRRELISFEHHGIMTPAYSPTGHILFHRFGEEHSVWALPFSEETLEKTGPPFIVSMDDGNPHVSRNGTLVMTRRIVGIEGGELIKFNPESGEMNVLFDPAGQYYDPALSPDGSTLAVAGFDLGAVDIWLIDFESGQHTRLTYDDSTKEVLPRWSPDGKVIAYAKTTGSTSARVGPDDSIHFVATDGSGETREPIAGGFPTFDDEWNAVVFTRLGETTGLDLYAASLDGSSEPTPIRDSPATEGHPALSPDGEFLAYVSDESGQQEVYVTRFPSGEGKWQVSTGIGSFPVWSQDGRRLYFAGSTVNVFEVEFNREGRIMIGLPQLVMDGPTLGINPYTGFSFVPDDQSLLMIRPKGQSEPPAIGVIKNWFAEFRDQ